MMMDEECLEVFFLFANANEAVLNFVYCVRLV